MFKRAGSDAEPQRDIRQGRQFAAQNRLHPVLRQTLLRLEKIVAHHFAPSRRLPVFPGQAAIGGDFADRVAARHGAGGAQLVVETPEIEMLQRALGKPLPRGDVRQSRARFHDHAGDAAHAEIERERRAHGACAHNNDIRIFHWFPCKETWPPSTTAVVISE